MSSTWSIFCGKDLHEDHIERSADETVDRCAEPVVECCCFSRLLLGNDMTLTKGLLGDRLWVDFVCVFMIVVNRETPCSSMREGESNT